MNTHARWLVTAVAVIVPACASAGSENGSPGRGDVITSEQMISANAQSAYDGVRKLRPNWFATRGPASINDSEPDVASVFLGGNQIGDIEALRNIRPDDIRELRYYEAGEASARFGMGHTRGVIEVIMRGSGPTP